jgi:hypothetical protein
LSWTLKRGGDLYIEGCENWKWYEYLIVQVSIPYFRIVYSHLGILHLGKKWVNGSELTIVSLHDTWKFPFGVSVVNSTWYFQSLTSPSEESGLSLVSLLQDCNVKIYSMISLEQKYISLNNA